ncbi:MULTISPECIES: ThiF family adenylyltransferase [Clostridia]|uniref:ThiF family adenylyltransferase n=1 Tax=Clostridia TaxID=186801 RepID=UPI001314C0CE|nr:MULTISPECIES: ThiF family adenylyltransferase [Clostridia]
MAQYWLKQPDVQVEETEHGQIICTLLNRTESIVYEGLSVFINFLKYLQEPRSFEELLSWGKQHEISNELIEETLQTLVNDKILLVGNLPWKLTVDSRLWSYLAAQTSSLDKLYNSEQAWNSSRVGIIGVGGVGSRVAHELAAMGIPSLILIDHDDVSSHNLTHQPLYARDSVGKLKVNVLKDILHNRYGTLIEGLASPITQEISPLLLERLNTCSIVILCADEPSVDILASWITPHLTKFNIPHIVGGGYHGHSTSTGTTVIPGLTGCWQCYDSLIEKKETYRSFQHIRGVSGSFNPLIQVLVSFIIADTVSVITKLTKPLLTNGVGDFNLETGKFNWRAGSRDEKCEICSHITNHYVNFT